MKLKMMAAAFVAISAGVFTYTHTHRAIPSDLRDAVAEKSAMAQLGDGDQVAVPDTRPVPANKGYISGNDPSAGAPAEPVEWITIPGGKFTMGTTGAEPGFADAKPVHEVTIKTFQMAKTAVTVEQYGECVMKGVCTEPGFGGYCNWGKPGRQLHPVNCVDWAQAQAYAKFKGARLPSESEWEYAATSGGKNQKYPWGNDGPTCDKVVMKDSGVYGCGINATMPVCSRPKGNTEQGLCDMAGNVFQWVQDAYKGSYKGAPADGRAVNGVGDYDRVVRGGAFNCDDADNMRADFRSGSSPEYRGEFIGFRLARDSR